MRLLLDLTKREANLIISKDILALSTVSQHGWPHCVPVSYVYLDGKFYIPANSKSKKDLTQYLESATGLLCSEQSGALLEQSKPS